jgi:ribose transport system ATP-binding protein
MHDTDSHTLVVDGLRKSFGSNEVLKGISLTIHSGEFIGLMGPNGAGKSTLIKILAGVYQASGGEIRLGGRTVTSLEDSEDVAFIHQDLGLVDALTIAENFALGNPPLRLFGPILNKRAERESAARALELVGLNLSVDALLSDLTPGQKTLVAVARAMDRGARILIVDEATSTLSPRDAQGVIRSLAGAAASGATVVMVTHKLSEILEATSRVLVILDGEMVRDAPTQGLDRAALVQMLMQHESDPHNVDDDHEIGESVLELRDVYFDRLGPINSPISYE